MHTAKKGQGFRPNLEAEWLSQPTQRHVGPLLMWVSVGHLPLFSSGCREITVPRDTNSKDIPDPGSEGGRRGTVTWTFLLGVLT